ncbi:MAG: YdjY domain-containing protein, partial [Pirellulales bacterium]
REGPLEMFACTRGTKEHESVVSIRVKAYMVHAALLAIGAEPGHPAQFTPAYRPASGTPVKITVEWIDTAGKQHRTGAQQWIRNARTGKAMSQGWVFAGSGFWTDEQTGKKYYQAEGGDFICVSNFPSAMLDLPIESSQANDALLFEAFTKQIPPLGTPVRLVLTPTLPPRKAAVAPNR